MTAKKPKIIAIVGPTASGKTSLSIALAKQFSGEIISADSRQVYRGLDIGTAKVTKEEMDGIPHHLLDRVEVTDTYTAHDFARDAKEAINAIVEENNLPIVVGGTFFYLDLLRGKMGKAPVEPDEALRRELEALPLPELVEKLQTLSPEESKKVDLGNPRRVIRAIEIITELGHIPEPEIVISDYDWLIIGLQVEKEILRLRYQERSRSWLKNGFLEEVAGLLDKKVSEKRLAELGFEYTLGFKLLNKEISEKEFVTQFEQKNWQYAKRQMTWLKRDEEINWFKPAETEKISTLVQSFLAN